MSKNSGVGSGGTQLFAVEKFGVEDKVLKMYKDRVPATKISKVLKAEGINIAHVGINRWLKAVKKKELEKNEIAITKKFEGMVMDYQSEITNILDEVKEMKTIAKEEKQVKDYANLVSKLFQGIELLAKLMGDIKPKGSTDIKIVINEINKQAFDKYKNNRKEFFCDEKVIEAEIIEEDKEQEEKLNEEN